MRRLYDNEPGSLSDKFEGFESMPIFPAWAGMESELVAMNRKIKRKRVLRTSALIGAPVIAAAVLCMTIWPYGAGSSYSPRSSNPTFVQEIDLGSHDDLAFLEPSETPMIVDQVEQPVEVDNVQQAQQNLAANPIAVAQNTQGVQPTFKAPMLEEEEPLMAFEQVMPSVGELEEILAAPVEQLNLDNMEVPMLLASTDNEMALLGTEALKLPKVKGVSTWGIVTRGGVDLTRTPNFDESVGLKDNRRWTFKPYIYQAPVSAFLGIKKRVTPRVSLIVGADYRMMYAKAESHAYQDRFAVREAEIEHLGVSMGMKYELLDWRRWTAYASAELLVSRPVSAMQTQSEYLGEELIQVREKESVIDGDLVNGMATLGLDYHLSRRTTLQTGLVINKPLKSYENQFNLYNTREKVIHGLRMGFSVSI